MVSPGGSCLSQLSAPAKTSIITRPPHRQHLRAAQDLPSLSYSLLPTGECFAAAPARKLLAIASPRLLCCVKLPHHLHTLLFPTLVTKIISSPCLKPSSSTCSRPALPSWMYLVLSTLPCETVSSPLSSFYKSSMYIFLSSHILQSSSRAAPKLLTCSDLPMENTPVFSISSAPRGPFPVLPHEQGMLLELILLASPSSSVFLIPTTTSFLMKLETQEAMTSMLAVTLGSQHCCAFRFPASEVSSRHHRRCPLHPNNESKRCRSTGLEAESYFGQCAASCQLKTQTFITEHVEVGSFNFLVLITSTSQRGGKLNPADFLVG